MTNEPQTFTTDSSPGEQSFERTATNATTHIAELFGSESEYWGPRMHATLKSGVRTALRADGKATAESVERVIENNELEERFRADDRTKVLKRFDSALGESSEDGGPSQ